MFRVARNKKRDVQSYTHYYKKNTGKEVEKEEDVVLKAIVDHHYNV